MSLRYSLNKPHPIVSFMEKLNFFIEEMDRSIQKAVKKGLFVSTHNVKGIIASKYEKD